MDTYPVATVADVVTPADFPFSREGIIVPAEHQAVAFTELME
jgi:hypothetical protein